ncbi:MAG TPA: T9SS type A sorting domain-containing protein [Bacteroidales bacterium]|nr:T9SS type A sorting domain-containing protein [Bacteroidales bacterium]
MKHLLLLILIVVAACKAGFSTSPGTAQGNTLQNQVIISNPFPNPARDLATFEYFLPAGAKEARLVVRNLTGLVEISQPLDVSANKVELDTSRLRNGIYLYSIEVNNQGVISKRLVISR